MFGRKKKPNKKSKKQLSRERELQMTRNTGHEEEKGQVTPPQVPVVTKKPDVVIRQPAQEHYAPERFYPARNVALVHTSAGGGIYIVPCNVYGNGKISYPCPEPLRNTSVFKDIFKERNQLTATITRPPDPIRIPYRETMPTWMGRRLSPKYMTFLAYSVHPNKSFTINPAKEADDIDVVTDQVHRALMNLEADTMEADWKGSMVRDMKKKTWEDYLPMIFIFLEPLIIFGILALAGVLN